MNKEYIYINGNVVVKDELGNQKPIEYSDNIDEILKKENIIEAIENRLNVLRCSDNQFKKIKFKDFIPWLLIILSSFFLIIPGYMILKSHFEYIILSEKVISLIKGMFLFSGCTFFISIIHTIWYYVNFKITKSGNDKELELLEKRLNIEKENLIKLKKDKTVTKENKEFRVVKINSLEDLKKIRKYCDLYYKLGILEKKYLKYYQENILTKKLSKYYNDEELKIIEDYFKEKEFTLVKKK